MLTCDKINKAIDALKMCHTLIVFNPMTGEDIDPLCLNEDNRDLYYGIETILQYIKQLEAERDAAVDDLEELRLCNRCNSCKHNEDGHFVWPDEWGCSEYICKYEKRGAQKEDSDA